MSKNIVNKNAIRDSRGDRILNWCITVILVVIMILVAYPLYLTVIASFSEPAYISTGRVFLFPRGLNVDAYKLLLDTKEIWIGYRNSIFYTVVGTAFHMIVTTMAAYAVSKNNLPGRGFFNVFFIFTMYFTGGVIPTYLVLRQYKMINTIWCMLLPGVFGPYNMIICRNYFESSIPGEIYESAEIDGAGHIQTFLKFAVPLAKPVLAVMLLNYAISTWNTYFNAMIYITNDNIQCLQVFIKRITATAVSSLESGTGLTTEVIVETVRKTQLLKYAVVVVSSVPMICLYPFIQRYFVQGIMLGSVKG